MNTVKYKKEGDGGSTFTLFIELDLISVKHYSIRILTLTLVTGKYYYFFFNSRTGFGTFSFLLKEIEY